MQFNAWDAARPAGRQQHSTTGSATVLAVRDDGTCLPQKVTTTAPSCAISCIQAFIARSFGSPSCDQSSDLNFLCTTVSQSGYTLGEGGLQCLLQACPGQSQASIYGVCNGVSGAQPKTQPTITVTVSPSSTGAASNALATDIQLATVTATQGSGVATDTAKPPSLSSLGYVTADAPFPASTSTSIPISGARPGQMAGIAVGSAAGAFGLLGVIFFFWRRRRRARRSRGSGGLLPPGKSISQSSSAQVSTESLPAPKDATVVQQQGRTLSPVESIAAAIEAAQAGITGPVIVTATVPDVVSPPMIKRQKTRSYWRKSIKPEEIGVAVSPREGTTFVRKSQSSNSPRVIGSVLPISKSTVPRAIASPTTTIGAASEQIGERMSYTTMANATAKTRRVRSIPGRDYSQEKQVVTNETSPINIDVEAQQRPSPPPVQRTSVLSSARASLVGLGTMLARSISLKRESSDVKPLLKSAANTSKGSQPTGRYPLTPKYDNGYFDPKAPLTSPTPPPPENNEYAPRPRLKAARKPTFSSFVAGKLLHSASKSPPADVIDEEMPPLPSAQPSLFEFPRPPPSINVAATDASFNQASANMALLASQDLAGDKSPGMIPAPLTIRKTRSSRSVASTIRGDAPNHDRDYPPNPPLPQIYNQEGATQFHPVASRKAAQLMGFGSPTHVQQYAQKPLPMPSPLPNPFANLAPIFEHRRLSAVDTIAAVKAAQHEQEHIADQEIEIPDPPLSAATTSWLSVPASTPPITAHRTPPQSPPYRSGPPSSILSSASASPRGKPGFPSMAPSLSSIITKYKYSRSQLPNITPTSAITLTAATYKPPLQSSQPMPTLTVQSSFLRDPSPAPGAISALDVGQTSKTVSVSDQARSEIQSNISSPQQFTGNINPYNPYYATSPMRQASTSSSRSQSVALSSHPTAMISQSALASAAASNDGQSGFRLPAATYQNLNTTANAPQLLGYRQTSELFSPDSADPQRESFGMFPKIVVTPNKTPGGDLVLTVDTTGKGYGA